MNLSRAEISSDISSDQEGAYNDHYDDYMYDESFEDIFKVTGIALTMHGVGFVCSTIYVSSDVLLLHMRMM